MTETLMIRAGMILGVLFFALSAGVFLFLNGKTLAPLEHALRSRVAGAILMFLALAWCIPQIRAVAWDALAPWLWPLAVAATVLAFFYLDNVLPRAIAGVLIMGAYTFLQFSFAHRLGTGIWGAAAAWSWGVIGILIAAKPCWLRDFFRLAARSLPYRAAAVAAAMGSTLLAIAATVMAWKA